MSTIGRYREDEEVTSGQQPLLPPAFGLLQRWERLLFLHWRVPVDAVRPLVPPRLSIDTHHGWAYVSLSPFTITGFRPTYTPAVPWLSDFYEVNARTYVHLDGRERGVWFFSLDASRLIAVLGARYFYQLPYHHAEIRVMRAGGDIHYTSNRIGAPERTGVFHAVYTAGAPIKHDPSSLHFFLTERYVLYSSTPDGQRTFRARIHHDPGQLRQANVKDFESDLLRLAGVDEVQGDPIGHYWERKLVQADLPEEVP